MKHFIVYSLQDFVKNIRSFDDMPYQSPNGKEGIVSELEGFVRQNNYPKFFSKIRFWLAYAENTRYKNSFEYDHIKDVIKEYWQTFRNDHPRLSNDDDEIDAQILDEDISAILR